MNKTIFILALIYTIGWVFAYVSYVDKGSAFAAIIATLWPVFVLDMTVGEWVAYSR